MSSLYDLSRELKKRKIIRLIFFNYMLLIHSINWGPSEDDGPVSFWGKIPFVKSIFKSVFHYSSPSLIRNIANLKFENPIGLAAGLDKDAEVFEELGALGFGFVEIGTVTPIAQTGNPQPRLFRLKKDKALINRMGFNNKGVDFAVEKLKKRKNKNLIIGGNIGKNKITPLDEAEKDCCLNGVQISEHQIFLLCLF